MIRVTGDTHGELSRFSGVFMPGEPMWTADDKLIVTGDFGFVFRGEAACAEEKANLDALAGKPYEILFIDGNHEGFDDLERYPQETRYGAPVGRIRDNIFWLRRGYVYTIEGRTFFTMGGAHSVDIPWRLAYESSGGEKCWFSQEVPTPEELRRGKEALEMRNMTVDYILTHTAPRFMIWRILRKMPEPGDEALLDLLDDIYRKAHFRKWFFGHFHEDWQLNDQMVLCTTEVHEII